MKSNSLRNTLLDSSDVDESLWDTVVEQTTTKQKVDNEAKIKKTEESEKTSDPIKQDNNTNDKQVDQSTTPTVTKNITVQVPKTQKVKRKPTKVTTPHKDVTPEATNEENPKDVTTELRSPICCIIGHVDTGKTKILDKIRGTNVQTNEVGGITQQVGATFFPSQCLLQECHKVKENLELQVPGLLIIDTPGHEAFANLRQRGSSLCDLAILVVDIMHGVEPQTLESINLLKAERRPFVVALNKIDRCYGWNSRKEFACLKSTIKAQSKSTLNEFKRRAQQCINDLTAKAGMNFALYHENKNQREYINVVPTSAITGQGIPDLLTVIVTMTQNLMKKRITLNRDVLQANVLEVKQHEGLGTCIDVILIGGYLERRDTIVVCGNNGAIVSPIRALLTPQPLKELRVRGEYERHEIVRAAMGIRISAPDLDNAIAGTSLCVYRPGDDLEKLKQQVQEEYNTIVSSIDKSEVGIYVVASTLGSLEALLKYFETIEVPISGFNIGNVYKKDIVKASTMKERQCEQYNVVAAFNVKVDPEARKEAISTGTKIFEAEIIYHLGDMYKKHIDAWNEERKALAAPLYISPAKIATIPRYIFNKKCPLVFGVDVLDGELRVGTSLVCPRYGNLKIGVVESIEINGVPRQSAVKGDQVCIKVSGENIEIGRQITNEEVFVTLLTRKGIDVGKEFFLDEVKKHKILFFELKQTLGIE